MKKSVPVFIHLPKTGGTSVARAIEKIYSPAERIAVYPNSRNGNQDLESPEWLCRAIPDYFVKQAKIIYGHVSTSVGQLLGLDHFNFTILRHPLTRLISTYTFLKRDFDPQTWGNVQLLDFVATPPSWVLNNMTRHLAGEYGEAPVTDTMLALAKRRLEEMPFFGLFEHLAEFFQAAEHFLGWPAGLMTHANKSTISASEVITGERPTRDMMERIETLNGYDLTLYRHALEIYNERKVKKYRSSRFVRHGETIPETAHMHFMMLPDQQISVESNGIASNRHFHNGLLLTFPGGREAEFRIRWTTEIAGANTFECKFEAWASNEAAVLVDMKIESQAIDTFDPERRFICSRSIAVAPSARGLIFADFADPKSLCTISINCRPLHPSFRQPAHISLSAGLIYQR